MHIRRFFLRHPWLRRPLLYAYHKARDRARVRFWWSSSISSRSEFEGLNMVCQHTAYHGRMGMGSYIGGGACLNADIGRFTSIAPGVRCITATHALRAPFATTSPLFYSLDRSKNPERVTFARRQMIDEFRAVDPARGIDVAIGSDCWIGQEATLIGGVTIGDGAVVLAHAWVTKDVPPYAIVGGTPAAIIGYRYDPATIAFLLRARWWNNGRQWLEQHWHLLCDIEALKRYYQDHPEMTTPDFTPPVR